MNRQQFDPLLIRLTKMPVICIMYELLRVMISLFLILTLAREARTVEREENLRTFRIPSRSELVRDNWGIFLEDHNSGI